MQSLTALCLAVSAINGAPQGEVLNFSATWCGPCQSVAPTVERLRRAGYPIRKVDVDQHPELARKYGVESVPQFVLVVNGKEQRRLHGPQSEAGLKRMLAAIPVERSEPKETADPNRDKPLRIAGIPIPFLGKEKTLEADDIELVRGQNSATGETEVKKLGSAPVTNDPMQATVRLKVDQDGMISYGTGSVIASNSERTLIITCGHLFRNHAPGMKILVDIFIDGTKQTVAAQLIQYADREDVGLLVIAPGRVLPRVKICEAAESVAVRDLVFSVGCGGGEDPTKWQMFVKSVDSYVGASITECTQAPVPGRSGGGLFNRRGELIGICRSADKQNDTGLYSSVKEIHKLLDGQSLTALYRDPNATQTRPEYVADNRSTTPKKEVTAPALVEVASTTVKEPEAKLPTMSQLSEDEVAAIAAALQFSGQDGVRVSIESDESLPKGYRVVIINRVEIAASTNSQPVAQNGNPAQPKSAPQSERLEWENLLESRESQKPEFAAVSEEPIWARDSASAEPNASERYRRQAR